MYIDSSDVCQEVLKMFNLENYFIIKIKEIISKKKKIDCSILYGTNRHYILGKVLKLSFRLKSFSKYVTLRQMVFKPIISIEDYLSQQ
jgi:hypothetical protein